MASFRREYDRERAYSPSEFRELLSFHEARVDRLAAALLMPGFIVQAALENFGVSGLIPIYGSNILRLEDKLLARHEVSEYIVSEIGLGNEAMAI